MYKSHKDRGKRECLMAQLTDRTVHTTSFGMPFVDNDDDDNHHHNNNNNENDD